MISEALLQFVWESRQFNTVNLSSTSGETVEILHPGYRNTDGGPDFFNAKIKIGATLWAGNVEIHVKSSDWEHHQHQNDAHYQNLILHVVWENDREIQTPNPPVATVELKNKIPSSIMERYQKIMQTKHPVLCKDFIHQIPEIEKIAYFQKLYAERLERKTGEIHRSLKQLKNNWNEVFFRLLVKYLGGKVNQLPFELLAKSVSLTILLKHQDNLFQLEAILFGQAGFLNRSNDHYQQALKREYEFLAAKHQLQPIDASLWKFLRLRPPNFPTIRIAQLAAVLHQNPLIFQSIIDGISISRIFERLSAAPSEYWDTHYVFGKTSSPKTKTLGKNTVKSIIINVIVPLLFTYYQKTSDEKYLYKCFEILESLPAEKNRITEIWAQTGIKPSNSLESQALIQLNNEKCLHQQCLNCNFGRKILQL